MNEIVTKFIEEQKKEQEEKRQKEKRKHLLALGIVDTSESIKIYCTSDLSAQERIMYGYTNQDEKGYFKYKINSKPLAISDEDYEELCKVCPPKNDKIKVEDPIKIYDFAENAASIAAYVFLICGIIAFAILVGLAVINKDWHWLGIGIGIFLPVFATWAVTLVLVNISHKLDRLNNKQEDFS